MMHLDVRSNIKEVIAGIKSMPAEVIEPSTIRALNRAVASARLLAARELKKDYGALPLSIIKGQMRVTKARKGSLVAIINFANKRIPLVRYGVMATPAGLRGQGLPAKLLDQDGIPVPLGRLGNAFLNRALRTGSLNAFVRKGKPRYPLQVLLAPALSEAIVESAAVEAMSSQAFKRFEETLYQEIQYRMNK